MLNTYSLQLVLITLAYVGGNNVGASNFIFLAGVDNPESLLSKLVRSIGILLAFRFPLSCNVFGDDDLELLKLIFIRKIYNIDFIC